MKTLSLLILLVSNIAYSANPGRFTEVRGDVTIKRASGDSTARTETPVEFGDKISGDEGAFAIIQLDAQTISLRGPFSIELEKPTEKSLAVVSLLAGKLRMLVKRVTGSAGTTTVVKTPGSIMGVRGTDFFASYDGLMGESETICFDHEIGFRGAKDTADVPIKAGQWGGIGGRFGDAIRPPMTLGANVLSHFKKAFPLEAKGSNSK